VIEVKKDKEKLVEYLNKLIKRSQNWQEDADNRDDNIDLFFYKGQKDMAEEIKTYVEYYL
jgi:hypothetical protein